MTPVTAPDCSMKAREEEIKRLRARLVAGVRETILVSADILELENRQAADERSEVHVLLREPWTDPELLRRFLDTPVWAWVSSNFVSGSSDQHFLCKTADLLHELAPRVFRRPGDPPADLVR